MKKLAMLCALVVGACGGDDGASDGDAGVDAPACSLPATGACQGNVLVRCDGDQTVMQNCTETMSSCGVGDGGNAACVDECAVAGVSDVAVCRDNATVVCDTINGRHAVIATGCGFEETCSQPGGGAAATCVASACAGIGPVGHCSGDMLVRCASGAPQTTDCAGSGMVCGYSGDVAGYGCVAQTTPFVVTGIVRYEDRPPQIQGGLGAITPAVARGAEVSVVRDSDSVVLATAHTGDDGSYTLRYDTTQGTMVHVMATARSTVAARPVRVYRAQSMVHAFGGTSFAAAASVTSNVLVTDASGASAAFNILDQGMRAMDALRALGETPVQLNARWAQGSTQGTYYSQSTIYMLGSASDDDGYDDTVILHEIGHFIEDRFSRSDSMGGAHDGSPADPNLAWSEGWATYFAMSVRGAPYYMDTNAGGGWVENSDMSATSVATGSLIGTDVSENTVTEILWDIGDGGDSDDDLMSSATHVDVLGVTFGYLATATLRSVGEPGVDLVDFLDGWFVQEGRGSCGGVRYPVSTRRMFPYDYAGPGGACP
ncbi:MAG TPA: hypothetical protein VM261_30825 [Kofleriaceae bacterium]|nr:hypothetical protein [Kofleriaceae bacterium]